MDLSLAIHYLHGIADALGRLSTVANLEGDYKEALRLATRAVPFSTGTAYESFIHFLASVAACGLENYDVARYHFNQLLYKNIYDLVIAAFLMQQGGQIAQAVELLGLECLEAESLQLWERWPLFITLREQLQQALGPTAFEAAWARGQDRNMEMTKQELARYFLSDGLNVRQAANQALDEPPHAA